MSAKGAAFTVCLLCTCLSSPLSPVNLGQWEAELFRRFSLSARVRIISTPSICGMKAPNLNKTINSTSQCDQVNDHLQTNKIIISMIMNQICFCSLCDIRATTQHYIHLSCL